MKLTFNLEGQVIRKKHYIEGYVYPSPELDGVSINHWINQILNDFGEEGQKWKLVFQRIAEAPDNV